MMNMYTCKHTMRRDVVVDVRGRRIDTCENCRAMLIDGQEQKDKRMYVLVMRLSDRGRMEREGIQYVVQDHARLLLESLAKMSQSA